MKPAGILAIIFALILGIWALVDYKQNYDQQQDDASQAKNNLTLSTARQSDALDLEKVILDNRSRRFHGQPEDLVAEAKAKAKLREDVQPGTDKDQLDIGNCPRFS